MAPTPLTMFHGSSDLKRVLTTHNLFVSRRAIDEFFSRLQPHVDEITRRYVESTIARNRARGVPRRRTLSAIRKLSTALARTQTMPFSEACAPFVDIRTGRLTPLGELAAATPETAKEICSPESGLIREIASLEANGVSFEDLVRYSYEAFGYARSGIATSATASKPLLWLPLGNSLFVARVMECLLQNPRNHIVIVNVGAGPGALEQLVLTHLRDFLNRICLISVEQDSGSVEKLRAMARSAGNALFDWIVVEGDITRSNVQQYLASEMLSTLRFKPFVVLGYALHHISPTRAPLLLDWIDHISSGGVVQIHDVSGEDLGGGQSPVNRVFFDFMTFYHLSLFHPNSFFYSRSFSRTTPEEIERAVASRNHLFVDGTTPAEARKMAANGSIAVFTKNRLE